jgi:hypothetical protein
MSSALGDGEEEYQCHMCTSINPAGSVQCDVCGTLRNGQPVATSEAAPPMGDAMDDATLAAILGVEGLSGDEVAAALAAVLAANNGQQFDEAPVPPETETGTLVNARPITPLPSLPPLPRGYRPSRGETATHVVDEVAPTPVADDGGAAPYYQSEYRQPPPSRLQEPPLVDHDILNFVQQWFISVPTSASTTSPTSTSTSSSQVMPQLAMITKIETKDVVSTPLSTPQSSSTKTTSLSSSSSSSVSSDLPSSFKSQCHRHVLTYSDDSKFETWLCDECQSTIGDHGTFHCFICDFDLCVTCMALELSSSSVPSSPLPNNAILIDYWFTKPLSIDTYGEWVSGLCVWHRETKRELRALAQSYPLYLEMMCQHRNRYHGSDITGESYRTVGDQRENINFDDDDTYGDRSPTWHVIIYHPLILNPNQNENRGTAGALSYFCSEWRVMMDDMYDSLPSLHYLRIATPPLISITEFSRRIGRHNTEVMGTIINPQTGINTGISKQWSDANIVSMISMIPWKRLVTRDWCDHFTSYQKSAAHFMVQQCDHYTDYYGVDGNGNDDDSGHIHDGEYDGNGSWPIECRRLLRSWFTHTNIMHDPMYVLGHIIIMALTSYGSGRLGDIPPHLIKWVIGGLPFMKSKVPTSWPLSSSSTAASSSSTLPSLLLDHEVEEEESESVLYHLLLIHGDIIFDQYRHMTFGQWREKYTHELKHANVKMSNTTVFYGEGMVDDTRLVLSYIPLPILWRWPSLWNYLVHNILPSHKHNGDDKSIDGNARTVTPKWYNEAMTTLFYQLDSPTVSMVSRRRLLSNMLWWGVLPCYHNGDMLVASLSISDREWYASQVDGIQHTKWWLITDAPSGYADTLIHYLPWYHHIQLLPQHRAIQLESQKNRHQERALITSRLNQLEERFDR